MTRHLLQIIIITVWIAAVTVVIFGAGTASVPRTHRIPPSTHFLQTRLHFPSTTAAVIQLSSFDRNPFNLKNPSNLKDSIEYDPKTNRYYLMEKIGNKYYRTPTYLYL